MAEHAGKPKVRFAGFTETWEQRKLVSLCEKFTDGDWIEAKDQSNSGVRLIQTGNVGLGEYIDKQNNKKWISKETFERLNCEEVFSGDILISRLPEPAGRACIVPNLGTKMITAVDCTIVRTATQVNPKYLLQYLSSQSYFDEVNTCLAGGTRQRISRSNLATFDVSMPVKYEEQKAIGEFLCGMDHLITLHQRKRGRLENIKKAMLEKMFPKNGADVPEVRFAGFTEAWEQRKLGDLAEFNPKAELPTNFEYVDLESVVGTELINHRTQTKCTAPSRAQRLAQYGDLFYQLVRPYQKNNYLFELNSENFVFSTGYAQLRPSVDGYFLMSLVQNEYFVQKVLDNCTGTSYPAINVNDLAEINIYTSLKKSEQARIGTFFRQLDRLVTLHQRKVALLQNIKKACLEKMFV